MKTRLQRTWLLLLMLLVSGIALRGQEEARTIFEQATGKLLTGQMELSLEVEQTDRQGRVKYKAYDILMGSFGEVEKIRMVMQKPDRAKGVTIVVTNQPDSTGHIEVFTPANGKVRKMEATDENLERVGAQFFMNTYGSDDLERLDFTWLEPGEVDGQPCYHLEVREPGSGNGGGARFLIAQDTYDIRQILFLDEKDRQTFITNLDQYSPVEGMDGKAQPMRIRTRDLKKETQTLVTVLHVQPRLDLNEEEFNIENLAQ
jgi:hypothetical protein